MKKYLTLCLSLFILLCFTACSVGQTNTENPEEAAPEEPAITSKSPSETAVPPETGTAGTNILVAYFSYTGTTKTIAEYAAGILGADLYGITPETPYTQEDLDYNDSSSRANREQGDTGARPAISGPVTNMEDYDTIFLGYPIWHGQAPRIISTFLESHDFSGKGYCK